MHVRTNREIKFTKQDNAILISVEDFEHLLYCQKKVYNHRKLQKESAERLKKCKLK